MIIIIIVICLCGKKTAKKFTAQHNTEDEVEQVFRINLEFVILYHFQYIEYLNHVSIDSIIYCMIPVIWKKVV